MACCDGGEHDEVLTAADDPDRYDPGVFANHVFTPPNDHQWGYCARCMQPFRWSVLDQRWRPWPSGLALLPRLTDEELEEIQAALKEKAAVFGDVVRDAQSPQTQSDVGYHLLVLNSLMTAAAEARYGLFPPEGPHAPRVWGEAWDVLERWLGEQLAGVARSSPVDATEGARQAFEATKRRIAELREEASPDG